MLNSSSPTFRGDAIALVTEKESVSYADLLTLADEIASIVPPRSIVVFLATNTVEAIAAYVGFLRRRVVPLMVSSGIQKDAFDHLVSEYRPEYIWCSDSFDCEEESVGEWGTSRLLRTKDASREGCVHPDLALLLSTSGSTGSCKYVRLSYSNLKSNTESIVEYLGIVASDRAITTLPFSYSYGISIINSHLMAGASVVLSENGLFDRSFWKMLVDLKVTTFGGVPYTYSMLKRLHFDRMDTPHLRYITQAGGHLPEALQSEFAEICRQKNIDFVVMYGQTEATARLSYLPPEYAATKIGCVGQAIPGGKFALLDDAGEVIAETDTPGELVYWGDNVSLGYAERRADLSRGDERNGFLETGDIALVDEEGFYRIVGRKKRFIKVFGNRVNLDEVEALLLNAGVEAACAGTDDAMVIYVASSVEDKDVVRLVSDFSGLNRSAFSMKRVAELPRNASGKIRYAELEHVC